MSWKHPSFLKILKKQKSDQYFWNDRCNYCLEKKEDYIFFSDPDEIPNPKLLKDFNLKKKYGILLQSFYN